MKKNPLVFSLISAVVISISLVTNSFAAFSFTNAHPYISGNIAASKLPNSALQIDLAGQGSIKGKIEYKNGIGGGVAFGAQLDNLRIEGAYDYFKNTAVKALDFASIPDVTLDANQPGGTVISTAYMINNYYDLKPPASSFVLTPYLGIGLGLANVTHVIVAGGNKNFSPSLVFAYQGNLGVSFPLTETIKANLDYHYLATVSDKSFTGPATIKKNYANHRIALGLTATL